MVGIPATALRASPLADRVLLRSLEAHDRTAEGLYIPDTARERPQFGEIVAVGAGAYQDGSLLPMNVAVGDKVLYERRTAIEIVLDGLAYLLVRERDLLAVFA